MGVAVADRSRFRVERGDIHPRLWKFLPLRHQPLVSQQKSGEVESIAFFELFPF